MTDLREGAALIIDDDAVSLNDLLSRAKLNDRLQFIHDAVDAALIRRAAAARGILVDVDELQRSADHFRASHDLYDAQATESWLASRHLSVEEWEVLIEEQCTARKLREALTAGRVEQFFSENRFSFEEVTISRIMVEEEDAARELRAQVAEDGADFHALARQYSADGATRPAGGYAGPIRRTDMEAAVEAAVYGARPGDIAGPFKTGDGWVLIKVESFRHATLDDATCEHIKSLLFEEWLDERRRLARLRIPLLELAG